MTGSIQLTVANKTDDILCEFVMAPARPSGEVIDPNQKVENWFGDGSKEKKLSAGESIDFQVADGVYDVVTSGCKVPDYTAFKAAVAIHAPTYLSIGKESPTPKSGEQVVTLAAERLNTDADATAYAAKILPVMRGSHAGGASAQGANDQSQANPAEPEPEQGRDCVASGVAPTSSSQSCCGGMTVQGAGGVWVCK